MENIYYVFHEQHLSDLDSLNENICVTDWLDMPFP